MRKRISKRKSGKADLSSRASCVCGMAQVQREDGSMHRLSSSDFRGWITVATPVGRGGKPVRLSHCACTGLSACVWGMKTISRTMNSRNKDTQAVTRTQKKRRYHGCAGRRSFSVTITSCPKRSVPRRGFSDSIAGGGKRSCPLLDMPSPREPSRECMAGRSSASRLT